MDIKEHVKEFRNLQKSNKRIRVADYCREHILDYYDMVEALKQDKFSSEDPNDTVQCGDLIITDVPESNVLHTQSPSTETYIREVMLKMPSGMELTFHDVTPQDLVSVIKNLIPDYRYA